MALLNTLQDPFIGANLNTALWTQFTGGSATMSYGNGASTVFPATTSGSTDGDLSSIGTFDMTGNGAFLNVMSVPLAAAANTDCSFLLKKDASNYLQIQVEAGTIFAQKVVANVQTNITSQAYSPTKHAWWQIRESGGTTFWEFSTNPLNGWTLFTSQANPITVTAMTVLIAGVCFGVDTNPAPFTFRYFNVPFANGPYRHLEVKDGMSRGEVAN